MSRNCSIDFEMLVNYVEDDIGVEDRARLESHLIEGCSRCHESLAWLQRTVDLMRTDMSVSPPPLVVERAKKLFRQQHGLSGAWLRRVVATLLFDSSLQGDVVGVRSGSLLVRQLLYGTSDFDIDFLIEELARGPALVELGSSRQARVNLSCQILPRGPSSQGNLAYEVALVKEQGCVFFGRASSLGEITIDGLHPGKYDLHISVEEGDLVVEGIEI